MNTTSFEAQPSLQGDLVSLRPLRPEDFASLFDVARDPLIWQQHPASNRYLESVFQVFFGDALKSGGALIAHDVQSKVVVGSSRYFGWGTQRNEVEIGWTFLARSCWGGRFNAELKRLMLQHAFRFVDSVVFNIGAQNIRSQRAVLKLGATEEARTVKDSGVAGIRYRLTRLAYSA